LTALATDNAGNTNSALNTFVYDIQKPTSTINPTPYVLNAWTTVTGKANDQVGNPIHPSGIGPNNVAVAFEQMNSGYWWDGSNFAGANPTYLNASFVGMSSGTWTFNLPAGLQAALLSGTSYYVVSRESDTVGNIEFGGAAANIPPATGLTVIYDTAPPTAVITLPTYGALTSAKAIETIGNITGTASGDVGISSVSVAIYKNGSPGYWYNGTNAFNVPQAANAPYWLATTGTATWTYTNGNLTGAMADNALYTFITQANALSGLTQATYTAPVSSFTVIMDQTPPTTTITAPPANGMSYKPTVFGFPVVPSLAGTVSDPNANDSGVKDVQVRLSYLFAGNTYYWGGGVSFSSTTAPTAAWQTITTAGPGWSELNSITWPSDMSHAMKLESRAEDNALQPDGSGTGNIDVPATSGTDIINFNIDFVAPSGTITYPSPNAAVSSTTVQITGSATDDLSGIN